MKKGWKYLLLTALIGFCATVSSQEKTNVAALTRLKASFSDYEKASLSKALQLSKTKGWPVSSRDAAGNFIMLAGVDENGFPVYISSHNNLTSAATVGTNQLWAGGTTGLNLNGSSASVRGKMGIWDEGMVRGTHIELTGRVIQQDNASTPQNHATHVAGTLIASGVNPLAKGMAFGFQQLQAYDFNSYQTEMAGVAANLLLSNHSYGQPAGWQFNSTQNRWEFNAPNGATEDYKFGYYSADAQRWDELAYNAPNYLIVKSAGNNRSQNGPDPGSVYWGYDASNNLVNKGERPQNLSNNDGYDIISTYGTAKNILTIGAVDALPSGYYSASDVKISDFSSWGPTDDGRIKPDLVAVGTNVLSSYAGSDNAYTSISGTSMATPNVTGSLLLLQELYAQKNGNAVMRSATLKGIALHTADEAGANPGPDYIHGWGLLNMVKAAAVITNRNAGSLIEERTLNSGTPQTITVVASGKEPLVVSICWTDPKGEVTSGTPLNSRTSKLVHDLDVRVTRGSQSFLPWRLNVLAPSAAATRADNTVDNFEKIEVLNPIPGETYTITVSNKGTLSQGPQAYSLIATGVNGITYCTSASAGTGGILEQLVAGSTTYTPVDPSACVGYMNVTGSTISAEPASNLSFSAKLTNCGAGTNAKMAKIFIDFNNNGTFDVNEQVAATVTGITGNGTFSGTIAIPATVSIGSTTRLRLVIQETTNINNISACGNYGNGSTYDFPVSFVKPSKDVRVTSLVYPAPGECANPAQRVTLRLRNQGTGMLDSIPVRVIIKSGATEIVNNLNFYRGKVRAGSEVQYTGQFTFATTPGASYTIEAYTTFDASNDQNLANDTVRQNITIAAASAAPTGTATICGPGTAQLRSNESSGNLLWYTTSNGTVPIGAGQNVNTTSIPANNTFYLGRNDFRSVAAPGITTLGTSTATYNRFTAFNNFSNSTPVIIEGFRVYTATSGKITLTVANLQSFNGTNISYIPLARTVLDVQRSRNADGSDAGRYYQVNLPVNETGDHILLMELEQTTNGDTVYAIINQNLATNPYPIGNAFFRLTGNSNYNNDNPNNFQKFFYLTYDIVARSQGCASASKTPIVAQQSTAPVITQNSNLLTSNVTTGLQWYRNNIAIPGATGATYTIIEPGSYRVDATVSGCTVPSNTINALVTALVDLDNISNGVLVAPNPNNGNFELAFQTTRTGKLAIALYNTQGQAIYNENRNTFTGTYRKNFALQHLANGIYWLKITHAGKEWTQKLVIAK
ncbi:S8 family serine peptidase [Parasegetibacter sp. NRK P23]|uniref:S8 family serine peptidase n=1 Tax=Parasegetibacter sp. NRK P23 TaxID=2942999 RepID=UPI00204339A2|nr:S8 family serine peptidase [Parasegetibacter sp. NRK P23]MCM5530184.1 S8 family serine peptidase [Parasegetibacter sp. NRK P23]